MRNIQVFMACNIYLNCKCWMEITIGQLCEKTVVSVEPLHKYCVMRYVYYINSVCKCDENRWTIVHWINRDTEFCCNLQMVVNGIVMYV
jgi:hypothetical protein